MQQDNFPQKSHSLDSFHGDGKEKRKNDKKSGRRLSAVNFYELNEQRESGKFDLLRLSHTFKKKKSTQKHIDYSLFKKSKQRCTFGHCDYLDRITAALKYYDKCGKHKFIDFCSEYYSSQCLTDYIHLLMEHKDDTDKIVTKYGITHGPIETCQHTKRHLSSEVDEKEEEGIFYIRIFDQIHFALCHLKESGYRITHHHSPKEADEKGDDNDYNSNNTDIKTQKMIKEIQSKMMKGEGNSSSKFNIVVDDDNIENIENLTSMYMFYTKAYVWNVPHCTANQKHFKKMKKHHNIVKLNHGNQTLTDNLLVYIFYKHDADLNMLDVFHAWIGNEQYDSDSIRYEVLQQYGNFVKEINAKTNKFVTEFMRINKVRSAEFSTGWIFFYWQYFKDINQEQIDAFKAGENKVGLNHNDYRGWSLKNLYIGPHFCSMEEEILESGFFSVSALKNSIMFKAKMYIENDVCKQMKCIHGNKNGWYRTEDPLCFGIKTAEPLHLEHLIALILYCDYTDFSRSFSKIFRKKYWLESLESLKKRHCRFHHIAKRLNEMVCYFGISGNGTGKYNYLKGEYKGKQLGPFYCGMDRPLNIGKFAIRLNGPISTSTQREVAMRFCGEDGLILQFNNKRGAAKNEVFMDCSWLSRFGFEEAEKLFIRGRYKLELQSIRVNNKVTNQWLDYKIYNHAFYLFHCMITGGWPEHGTKVIERDMKIIRDLINHSLHGRSTLIDEYIIGNFKLFVQNTTQIVLNLHDMDKYIKNEEFVGLIMNKVVKRDDFGEDDFNLFKEDVLSMFVNLKEIIIYSSLYSCVYALNIVNLLTITCSLSSSVKRIIIKDCAKHSSKWVRNISFEMKKKVNKIKNLEMDIQIGRYIGRGKKWDEDWMIIDVLFDEIPSPKKIGFVQSAESEKDIRSEWVIGDYVLAYCKSSGEWQKAQIVDIYKFNDDNEEWLEVLIGGNTIKEVKRFSTDIKPFACDSDNDSKNESVPIQPVIEKDIKRSSQMYYDEKSDEGYLSDHDIDDQEVKLLADANENTKKVLPKLPPIPKFTKLIPCESAVQIEFDCDDYKTDLYETKFEIESHPKTFSIPYIVSSPYTFPELINGKSYKFRMRAINKFGKSKWTKLSKAVIPLKIPPQPTALRSVPFDGQITVFWVCAELNTKEYDGWYEVESIPPTFTVVTKQRRARFIYDIKNGKKYKFKVTAINEVGKRTSKLSKICIPRHGISKDQYDMKQKKVIRELKRAYKEFQIQQKKKKTREKLMKIKIVQQRRMQMESKQIQKRRHKAARSDTVVVVSNKRMKSKLPKSPRLGTTQSWTINTIREQNQKNVDLALGKNAFVHQNGKSKLKKKQKEKECKRKLYAKQLKQLEFLEQYDEDKNIEALIKAKGNVKVAFRLLLDETFTIELFHGS